MPKRQHRFGGSWTDKKLETVGQYLRAYTTALKNQPFQLTYVDAFAGTGYRTNKRDLSSWRGLFQMSHVDDFAKGSARVAVEVNPPFDRYVFVEKNREQLTALKNEMESEFPARLKHMEFIPEDANLAITKLCRTTHWRSARAVAFLDPYGMQVNWSTIEAIAATRAIDLWYLFPSGIGLNRLLTRSGHIPPSWQKRLDRMLGYQGWRNDFYEEIRDSTLFDGIVTRRRKVYDERWAESFILNRLGEIFAGVARCALPLRNTKGQCMYHLTFACGNKRGTKVALPIAEHILEC